MAAPRTKSDRDPGLQHFLGIMGSTEGADLCLPVFEASGGAAVKGAASNDLYRYPSETLSNRDVRSALYVQQILVEEFDASQIAITPPEAFLASQAANGQRRVGFLFGSRSNTALKQTAMQGLLDRLVTFSFGDRWTITGRDGRNFSIANPVELPKGMYEANTDFGVIARLHEPDSGTVFVIAGLGGRATEGAGLYLATHWQELHREAGRSDFAVVLSFAPPVDPARHERVAFYKA